jgi:hypothetical protein
LQRLQPLKLHSYVSDDPKKEDHGGKIAVIEGVIEEHLTYGTNEWVVVRLGDGIVVEINIRYVKEIK